MVCGSLPRCDSEPLTHDPGWLCGGMVAGGGSGNARAHAFRGGLLPGPCICRARREMLSAEGLLGHVNFVARRHSLSHVVVDRTRAEA
jgi:hypothetical protein